jgi:chromosome segregation ATPase
MQTARLSTPALLSLALTLAACASPSGDPCASANAPVSFGTLLSNSLSGNYDACIDAMRETLAVERLRARALESQAEQLRAESNRLGGEERAARRRLADMNERQAAIMAEIEQANRDTTVEQGRLESLLEEQRRLSEEVEALNGRGTGATAAEAETIRQRQARVRAQLEAVL